MDIQILPTTSKPDIFTCIFQNVRSFTEHISIIFKKEGIYFQTMDSSRISIIELTLPNTWFDTYNFTSTGDIVLGISSNILFKILNAREKQQKIHLVFEENDTLSIHFTSDDKSVFDKHFQCPLLDLESETMVIPDIDYAAEFTLQSSVFSTLINQLKTFGDTLDLECTEQQIKLTAKSPECGTMAVEVPIDDLNAFSINEGEELNMSFSLQSLHHICMFNKVTKEINIRLCSEYPLSVVFPITEEDAHLRVYLAPKITDE
jgi:proliferating cell nuclear antigen